MTYALGRGTLGGPYDEVPGGSVPDALTSSTWNVQPNTRYRAVFQLNLIDAEEAYGVIQDLGFTQTKFYQASTLPSDWPTTYDNPASDAQGNSPLTITVRAELLWTGSARALSRTLQLATAPATVLKAWVYTGEDASTQPVPNPNDLPAVPPGTMPTAPTSPTTTTTTSNHAGWWAVGTLFAASLVLTGIWWAKR